MFGIEVVVLGLGVKSSWHLLWAAGRELSFPGCLTDSSLWQVKHIDPICASVPCYLTKDTPVYRRDSLSAGGWLTSSAQHCSRWKAGANKCHPTIPRRNGCRTNCFASCPPFGFAQLTQVDSGSFSGEKNYPQVKSGPWFYM